MKCYNMGYNIRLESTEGKRVLSFEISKSRNIVTVLFYGEQQESKCTGPTNYHIIVCSLGNNMT